MEYLVLLFGLLLALKKLIIVITECIDEIIKLKSSLHKLRKHSDCHQSESNK